MITKSQVKYIQSLGQKKVRDEDQVFIAEGPKIINELLQTAHIGIVSIFALKSWLDLHSQQLAFTGDTEVAEVQQHELEKISFLSTPSQVLALVRKPVWSQPLIAKNSITLLLDGIQDPGNLGTIVRTADWFGIGQIVCTPDTADLFSPKVIQSTMGSFARVRVLYADPLEWLEANKTARVYVTMLGGKPLSSFAPIKEGIIVIGNESKGVSQEILNRADARITIEKKGNAESLNAAVATGIVLSQLI